MAWTITRYGRVGRPQLPRQRQALAVGRRHLPHPRLDRTAQGVVMVLLEDPRRACRWGLYVGETSRDPDARFDQHKAGYKASRAVNRFGVRLLPELVAHLNPLSRWEAVDLEEALTDAFRRAGVPWVEGGH
jgi:predicted GIY-YIG superfamily endonuclease